MATRSEAQMHEGWRFVAGVDACKGGWIVVLLELDSDRNLVGESPREVGSFEEVLALPEAPRFLAVDMPIGLLTLAVPGGRACDREARRFVGARRAASVFAPPVRAVLAADSYDRALALNRASSRYKVGISRQVYARLTPS
jgi:predicted RNase H-like nuclease